MSDVATLFSSCDLKKLAETAEELQTLAAVDHLGEEEVCWLLDPLNPDRSTFVAPTPWAALQWICRVARQKPLLKSVRDLKKRSRAEGDSDEDSDGSRPSKQARSGGSSNTRSAEQKRQLEAKLQYRDFWHNSQEAQRNAREEDLFNNERAQWLRFAGAQPEGKGVGSAVMAEVVRRATTVGNSDALRELQLSLQNWREQHAEQVSAPSSQRPSQTLVRRLTQRQGRSSTRYHYRHLKKCEQLGARSSIERRYSAARLRADYESRLGDDPDGVTTHARQRIQAQFFEELDSSGEPKRSNPHFLWFQRTLKHGKRWLSLEAAFGCGIFALLPPTRVPNTYIERTLTDELFSLWIRLILHCRPLVKVMSTRVSGVVEGLAENMLPPADRLALEIFAEDLDPDVEASDELASLLEPHTMHGRVSEIGPSDLEPTQSAVASRRFSNVTLPDSQEVEEDVDVEEQDEEAEDGDEEEEEEEEGEEDTGAGAKEEEEEGEEDTGAGAEEACSHAAQPPNPPPSNQQALFLSQANEGCPDHERSRALYGSVPQDLSQWSEEDVFA